MTHTGPNARLNRPMPFPPSWHSGPSDPPEWADHEPDDDTCACDMRHPDDDSPFKHHPYCIVGHRQQA